MDMDESHLSATSFVCNIPQMWARNCLLTKTMARMTFLAVAAAADAEGDSDDNASNGAAHT